MPRLRPDAHRRRVDIISAWQRHYGITHVQAAEMLGMSANCYYSRKRRGGWTLEEMHIAIRAFHIPPPDAALELLTVGCYPMEKYLDMEKRKKYGN